MIISRTYLIPILFLWNSNQHDGVPQTPDFLLPACHVLSLCAAFQIFLWLLPLVHYSFFGPHLLFYPLLLFQFYSVFRNYIWFSFKSAWSFIVSLFAHTFKLLLSIVNIYSLCLFWCLLSNSAVCVCSLLLVVPCFLVCCVCLCFLLFCFVFSPVSCSFSLDPPLREF